MEVTSNEKEQGKTPGHVVQKKKGASAMGMAARKIEVPVELEGEQIVEELCQLLSVKATLVAGLIEVTERSFVNWAKEPKSQLEGTSKGARLVRLHEFASRMADEGVRKGLILNALREPMNPDDEESCSPLYYIIHDPQNKMLKEFLPLLIKQYV